MMAVLDAARRQPYDLLASLTASAGSFGNVGTFSYGYVGNTGILARMDRPNGTSTLLSYENLQDPKSLHRLTGVQDVNSASGANIAGFSYSYDGASVQNGFLDNRTSQTRTYGAEAAQTVSYGYNPTSMLQGEGAAQGGSSTPAVSKSYQFDAMGNRTGYSDAVAKTQVTSTYNPLNQLTSQNSFSTASGASMATGSSSFGYDGDGNMALVSSKDATGSVTSQTSYSYDDASRLVGITTPNSNKWQFVYDGMSRLRISRSWKWINAQWVQDSEKRRVYLGMDVVQERDSQNNVIASYCGGLAARSTASGTVFYGFDGNGNVTSLTDATGAVVGSYTYDAWGNTIASSGPKAQENQYRYSGKEQLAGYYSYGYRFYSPGLGRWINRDPIEEDGGLNLYGMVGNDPTNAVDLYGEYGLKDFLTTIGHIAAGAGAKFGWGIESGLQLGLRGSVIGMVLMDAKSTAANDGARLKPPPFDVAFGLFRSGLKDFANMIQGINDDKNGKTCVWSATWSDVGIHAKRYPYSGLKGEILTAMIVSDHIHFNLNDFDEIGALRTGSSPPKWTPWEYWTIRHNPQLMRKTTFWRNGSPTQPIAMPSWARP